MRVPASLVGLLGVALPLPVAAQGLHYEGSASLASGTYIFAERTNSWMLSSGLALTAGPVTVRASVPAYLQNTTLVAGTATGPLPTGGASSHAVRDSSAARRGRGGSGGDMRVIDPVLSVSTPERATADEVDVPPSAVTGLQAAVGDPNVGVSLSVLRTRRLSLTLGATAKIPVSDTASLGTGAWDVGGLLSLSYVLGGGTMLSANFGYWAMGDMPELPLRNPVLGSVALAHLFRAGWGISSGVFGSQSMIEGFAAPVSIGAGLMRGGGKGSLGFTVSVGVTETAPDLSIAASWRLSLLSTH